MAKAEYTTATEEWRAFDENGHYEVSSLGRVRSVARVVAFRHFRKSIRPVVLHLDGSTTYNRIKICADGGGRKVLVHRLVATAFLPNPNGYKYVNHIDGNKKNNVVGNLEWCSMKQNAQHALRTGLFAVGEKSGRAILTDDDVRMIRRDARTVGFRTIARSLGVTHGVICNAFHRRTWTHVK